MKTKTLLKNILKHFSVLTFVCLSLILSFSLLPLNDAGADPMCKDLTIASDELPPQGLCRIWFPALADELQPSPGSCLQLEAIAKELDDVCLVTDEGVRDFAKCDDDDDDCEDDDDGEDDDGCDDGDDCDDISNLSVKKSDSSDPVTVGNVLVYVISVINHGPDKVKKATLFDFLPEDVELISVLGCKKYTEEEAVITCNLGRITNNKSKLVTVIVKPQAEGIITNLVSVESENPDPDTLDNTDTEETTVLGFEKNSDLSINKEDYPDPAEVDGELTYDLTISNHGPDEAAGVIATDVLPSNVELLSVSGCDKYEEESGVITCKLGSINSGDTKKVQIVVKPEMEGDILNEAMVSSESNDPDLLNNSVVETTEVISPQVTADLSVIKEDEPDPVQVDDPLTYDITVMNDGPETALVTTLTDNLPEGVELISVEGCDSYDVNDSELTCELGSIEPDDERVVKVVVKPEKEGTITNAVSVVSESHDPDLSNNSDSEETKVITSTPQGLANIEIGSGSGNAGTTITVPVIFTNASNPGVGISAISVDINFGAGLFENPLALIGPSAINAAKGIAANELSHGHFRVSIFSTANNNPIGNGILFYLSLHIKESAPVGVESILEGTSTASDPYGEAVEITTTDGIVLFTDFLMGDCDGNGDVDIHEVQAAVDMFLGIIPVESCADGNGDGVVDITELQTIIYNHLGLGTVSEESIKSVSPMVDMKTLFIDGASTSKSLTSDTPVLKVGDTIAAPGQTEVKMPLMLTNASGYAVAALGVDIQFDSASISNPRVDSGLASIDSGKEVVGHETEPGRYRIAVLSMENKEAIPDGPVAYLIFDVNAGISEGQFTINNQPSAASPVASTIPIEGQSGTLTVVEEGTSKQEVSTGSEFTVVGQGFGLKKGVIKVGRKNCRVTEWNDTAVSCLLGKPMTSGTYDIRIKTRNGDSKDAGTLTIMEPTVSSVTALEDEKGKKHLLIIGRFFGKKKGVVKVELENGKKRRCKVSKKNWNMDPITEDSRISCKLNKKVSFESIKTITVKNKSGSVTKDVSLN